ncbi:DUF305 domain-containing protein [Nonomuraea ferruginea]
MGESTIRGRGVARWLAALALLLVAACGSGDAGEPPVNADDVMFVQMMVQHHRQGIEMAGVGAERATTEELKTLAAAIVSTQQSEVEMMLRWLHAWGGSRSRRPTGRTTTTAGCPRPTGRRSPRSGRRSRSSRSC